MEPNRSAVVFKARTFVDLLCAHATRRSEQVAFRFVTQASSSNDLTYRALWLRAAALAQQLRERGLEGERVLLAITDGAHFVPAFFACLMAGAVAVPSPPTSRKHLAERLHLLLSDARAKAVVTESGEAPALSLANPVQFLDCRAFWANELNVASCAGRWKPPALQPSSLAFLQYTSGSTGDPKGVMVTHGNLIANCQQLTAAWGMSERSKVLTALPLFHDLGLIGGVMAPLFNGAEGLFIKPLQFVQHPEWWLRLISEHRVTISGGPNFMYDLAAAEVTEDQLQGMDLSSWRVAICGAEPIRATTLSRFAERFAPNGFEASSIWPGYGMAEATLFVTGVRVGGPVQYDRELGAAPVVGCGFPRDGTRVEVVDPKTHRKMDEGAEGEIWIHGASVAAGYWGRPQLTREVFGAFIADSADGPFLRSGDLGVWKNGELFITGRLKELVVVRGRKHAPHDIEQEVERSHDAVRRGGCVAFGAERETGEELVVVVELQRAWLKRPEVWQGVVEAIEAAIHSAFELCAEVVLIRPNSLPRTSSGKLKRRQARVDYLEGRLTRISSPCPGRDALSPEDPARSQAASEKVEVAV